MSGRSLIILTVMVLAMTDFVLVAMVSKLIKPEVPDMSPAKQFSQQRTLIPADASDNILFPNQIGSFTLQSIG